jgi:phenylalanyl-tRNA synthetase beta chain
VGLTPNRADATNHLGVAMDLAAYLRVHENESFPVRLPKTSTLSSTNPPFPVSVENQEACPRYAGIVIKGLKVQESPEWLKNRLLAVGQRPINNVVDVTNYVRIELGQPLHAFDPTKSKAARFWSKPSRKAPLFKTLDEVERKLLAEDLIICDGESNPMCIGGVFGGASSGVSDQTTSIFLESAFFSPKSIRRSMLRHGPAHRCGLVVRKRGGPEWVRTRTRTGTGTHSGAGWRRNRFGLHRHLPQSCCPGPHCLRIRPHQRLDW